MLPKNPPKANHKYLDLAQVQDETPEVQHDQFYDQVQIIKARNQRIADKQAGIEPEEEYHEQMPINKDLLKIKTKPFKANWSVYD